MTIEEAKEELRDSFPDERSLFQAVYKVKWTLLGDTIANALDAGRDDEVCLTIYSYNQGYYI